MEQRPASWAVRTLWFSLAAAALLGGLMGWLLGRSTWSGPVRTRVLTGVTTAVDADGGAIGLDTGDGDGRGFNVQGAKGRECLTPLEAGQRVRLGYVVAHWEEEGGAIEHVIWIRCLD
ncbi:MAG: hypothetical protein WD770_01745 [Actinomycetota bacterium]